MKHNHNNINESFSHIDKKELIDIVSTFKRAGGLDAFYDKLVGDDEELHPEVCRILDIYDPYVEDILFSLNDIDDVNYKVESIIDAAESNQWENGTEASMVVDFLNQICNYLNLEVISESVNESSKGELQYVAFEIFRDDIFATLNDRRMEWENQLKYETPSNEQWKRVLELYIENL